MAFLQETPQPFFRVPAVVPLLIVLLVGIELSREFLWSADTLSVYANFGFIPALYSRDFIASHHYIAPTWFELVRPFISYNFLHGGFAHVAANSIWLLAFGPVVARRYGSVLFLVYFLLCGIAGAVAELISAWGSVVVIVGASAAIAGLMGASFRVMGPNPREQAQVPASLLSRRILLWSAIWLAVNVIVGVLGVGAGPGIQLIAWQAHIGGYLMGLLLVGPFDALVRWAGHSGQERPI
ncbi:MAG: rhomboid family intramembrane serine protease [Rhizomicrobium sp.]